MKTIGLIGGMSWESTSIYYKLLNQLTQARLGGAHSAKLILLSLDFEEIVCLQRQSRWEEAGQMLAHSAQKLEQAGAEILLLGTNTMHKVAHIVSASTQAQFVHIADATADRILAHRGAQPPMRDHATPHLNPPRIGPVGFLGTRITMEEDFYLNHLRVRGIEPLVPPPAARIELNRIIFEELCFGLVKPASKEFFKTLIDEFQIRGAQGVVLGCTELGMLMDVTESLTVFDTLKIHCEAAVDLALSR